MLERQHWREYVGHFLYTSKHVGSFETQFDITRRIVVHLIPRHRRRDRRRVAKRDDVVLWCAFWLQSTKILPGSAALAMTVVIHAR